MLGGGVIRVLILRESEVRVTWNLGPSIFFVRQKYWRELTSGPPIHGIQKMHLSRMFQ